jgi:hypothetical protein
MSWLKTNNYYNREVVICDVWSKKISEKRTIYLQDSKEDYFTYTFSCGAHSQYSFTGCFFGTSIDTLEKAMEWLDKFAELHFLNKINEIKKLRESIKLKQN